MHLDAKISAAQLPPPPFKGLVKGVLQVGRMIFVVPLAEVSLRRHQHQAGSAFSQRTSLPSCIVRLLSAFTNFCSLCRRMAFPCARFMLWWLPYSTCDKQGGRLKPSLLSAAVMISKIDNCMLDLLAYHEKAVADEKERGSAPKPWTNLVARAGSSLRRSLDLSSHRCAVPGLRCILGYSGDAGPRALGQAPKLQLMVAIAASQRRDS